MSKTYRKCIASELKVGCVLNEIKEENSLLEHGLKIVEIKHGRPGSDLQRRHADFLVLAERIADHKRFPIPINAKSSDRCRRQFEVEMAQADLPHIRCVVVRFGESLRNLKDQVIRCLRTAVSEFDEGLACFLNSFKHFFDDPDSDEETTCSMSKRELRQRMRRLRRKKHRYFNFAPIHRGDWHNRQCCFAA